jgi:hypothetical protein
MVRLVSEVIKRGVNAEEVSIAVATSGCAYCKICSRGIANKVS